MPLASKSALAQHLLMLELSTIFRMVSTVQESPMLTKQWTSFVGFGMGDTIAQLVTEGSLDPTRTAILALYGWLVDAPCGNAFYRALLLAAQKYYGTTHSHVDFARKLLLCNCLSLCRAQ